MHEWVYAVRSYVTKTAVPLEKLEGPFRIRTAMNTRLKVVLGVFSALLVAYIVSCIYSLLLFDWNAISVLILGTTAVIIGFYTQATDKLVKEQVRPFVEVDLFLTENGTKMQFRMMRDVPAMVWTEIKVIVDKEPTEDSREFQPKLKGEEKWDIIKKAYLTSPHEEFKKLIDKYKNSERKLGLTMRIYTAPMYLPKLKTFSHEKNYRFENDKWLVGCWDIPERMCPEIEKAIKDPKHRQKSAEKLAKEKNVTPEEILFM